MIDSTKVILPASQAFRTGTLAMTDTPGTGVPDAVLQWSDYPANTVSIVIFTLLAVFTLKNFLNIALLLLDSLSRWKACVNIDASVQLKSDRNLLGYIHILPLALIADRYALIGPRIIGIVPPGLHSLATLGIVVVWLLLRRLLFGVCSLRVRRIETFRTAHKSFFNYLILMSVLAIVTAGVMSFFGCSDGTARKILLYEAGGMYLIAFLRKTQILRSFCNPFSTFLYLCALEIIPTGALIAGAILL